MNESKELRELKEKQTREHLILGHIAGYLKASGDPGHWAIGEQIEDVLNGKPRKDVKAAA